MKIISAVYCSISKTFFCAELLTISLQIFQAQPCSYWIIESSCCKMISDQLGFRSFMNFHECKSWFQFPSLKINHVCKPSQYT